ncbi:hypothetical protein KZZ52_03075 [Dactylosporangium sp. AC04546]|uniref:hypothetical protein n=1 Tax=Dactylosporangium sp. AC04546 TaxID=2862460 RepID=UPI001EDD1071|nr:hypothetical protein [Dactylosporangium sp. AC04546]WVK84435.1 hypothetical protein KZZ52_03075 [Dactylosporangium sp. AC04546]
MGGEWAIVSEDEALARLGPEREVVRGDAVTFAKGADGTVVIIVDAGDRPSGNAVDGERAMMLHEPFPDGVLDWLSPPGWTHPSFYALVRLPEGCLDLGEVSAGFSAPRSVGLRCELEWETKLPLELLDRVRPVTDAPVPGVDWLAHLPNDPGAALRDFLTGWYADLPAATPFPAPAVPIPPALQAFYDLAAGHADILGQQHVIYPPDRLQIGAGDDDRIIIGVEGQGVYKILIGRDDPDPTVYYHGAGDDLVVVERESLGTYLLLFSLAEAAYTSPVYGHALLDNQQLERFTRHFVPVPLQPLTVPADPTRLYVAPGLVALTTVLFSPGTHVFVGSRQRAALRAARDWTTAWTWFNG